MKLSKRMLSAVGLLIALGSGLYLAAQTGPKSLPAITSRPEFDTLAVTYDANTPYALPHILFVIDRKDQNRIYYVNTRRYSFHKDFVNGTYLSLERGREFFENNYLKPNRRFVLGTVAYQTPLRRWTFEFWEGDLVPSEQIQLASEIINKTFFVPVAFKPNSLRQDEASGSITGLQRVLQSDIAKEQEYQALNLANGLGRIHIISKLNDHVEIGFNEILVLDEVPIQLPPVAGIITSKPSTPLSHINLLAKGWGIPNAYIKNARELLKQYDGWWVSFETKRDNYTIKRADLGDKGIYYRAMVGPFGSPDEHRPASAKAASSRSATNRARSCRSAGSAEVGVTARRRCCTKCCKANGGMTEALVGGCL